MLAPRKPINVKTRTSRNNEIEDIKLKHPGPYMARVVSHLDKKFGGGLEVELVKSTSVTNTYEHEQQTYVVYYASPFYGVTPLQKNDANDTYASSQQSYGFWAVPPDPGSLVLVVFIEGNVSQGFWIACIQNDYMNFMIPEPRVSTTLTSPATPTALAGKKLPVAEYNKFLANPNNNYPTSQPKPYNDTFVETLLEQGLLDDDIRGVTSTSARREAPSNVYGMSTPGPIDKRPGSPTVERGVRDSKATVFASRLGGHSIVMDDGDETILRNGPAESTPKEYLRVTDRPGSGDPTLLANELFRIRTRTGHQILLHNTEDLIYISNSKGTSWIEMSSNGKIDIYAQDSVSIHSEQDLNFTADRDINLAAAENMNVAVGKDIRINAGDNIGATSGEKFSVDAGDSVSFRANTLMTMYANNNTSIVTGSGSLSIMSGANLSLQATGNMGLTATSSIRASAQDSLHMKAQGIVKMSSVGGSTHIKSGAELHMASSGSTHISAAIGMFIESTGNTNIKSGTSLYVNATGNIHVLAGTSVFADGKSTVKINTKSAQPATSANPAELAGDPVDPTPVSPVQPPLALMPSRIPQHEPWLQHENLNPPAYTPDRTRAGMQAVDSFTQPLPDTYLTRPGASTVGTTSTSLSYPGFTPPEGSFTGDSELPPGPLPTGANIKIAHQYLMSLSSEMTPEIAAGFVGNFMVESYPQIDPQAFNNDGQNFGARGIAQWRGPRVSKFRELYKKDVLEATLTEQLDFVWWELNNTHKREWGKIKVAKTATEAADKVETWYEGANNSELELRLKYAAQVYRLYQANYDPTGIEGFPGVTDSSGNSVQYPLETFDYDGNLTGRVDQRQGSEAAIRKLPLDDNLVNMLNAAAHAANIDRVVVVSGGQVHRDDPSARLDVNRIGSFRHDVWKPGAMTGGMAADFDLYVGGRPLNGNNAADRQKMASFISHAVRVGIRGVGWDSGTRDGPRYYMGPQRIHMDGYGASGSPCVWGYTVSSRSAVRWVIDAVSRGMPK